ncbi:hypothetical protein, partial [Bacillus cereus]|uniref:hypothetical protein n=1 Tax=Bacillus cereus TaxID=1396 RepID=UPI001F2E7A78
MPTASSDQRKAGAQTSGAPAARAAGPAGIGPGSLPAKQRGRGLRTSSWICYCSWSGKRLGPGSLPR